MLSEDDILHEINELNQTQDNLVRAWFNWQNDPTFYK